MESFELVSSYCPRKAGWQRDYRSMNPRVKETSQNTVLFNFLLLNNILLKITAVVKNNTFLVENLENTNEPILYFQFISKYIHCPPISKNYNAHNHYWVNFSLLLTYILKSFIPFSKTKMGPYSKNYSKIFFKQYFEQLFMSFHIILSHHFSGWWKLNFINLLKFIA